MNRLMIIKIGGNVLDDVQKTKSFLRDFASIEYPKILIHGGGQIATDIGKRMGIESKYIDGRRITDAETRDLVTMVYGGLLNKQLVAQLQTMNCNAIGLSGADGNAIKATKRPVGEIDYGFVGDIAANDVNTSLIYFLLKQNITPVIAPLTHASGELLNTNADTIASVMAMALSKHFDVRLILCFDKKGVLLNLEDETSVIHHLNHQSYQDFVSKGTFSNGMIPKLENSFNALQHGVKEVLIGHAEDLVANSKSETQGTLITA